MDSVARLRLPGLHHGIAIFLLGVLCTLTVTGLRSLSTAFIASQGSGRGSTTGTNVRTSVHTEMYLPAPVELYVLENTVQLGFDSEANPSGCDLWKRREDVGGNKNVVVVPDETRIQYEQYLQELKLYNELIDSFSLIEHTKFKDLRLALRDDEENSVSRTRDSICPALDLPLDNKKSGLSWVSSRTGFAEPLLPPLRHPLFCQDRARLMDLSYLVHDFGAICRRLTSRSRTVLIDMGASLSFHGDSKGSAPPVYLMNIYERFGITFDHIYAYELTQQDTKAIYENLLPKHLQAAYHWINAGVDWTPGAPLNPFTMLKENFLPEDFVVVKLDVDHAITEMPLVHQLLNDAHLQSLVDHFYFEHHVHLGELAGSWGNSMQGTVHQSLQLLYQLRKKGVAAHYWV